jgi:hypothetical protein
MRRASCRSHRLAWSTIAAVLLAAAGCGCYGDRLPAPRLTTSDEEVDATDAPPAAPTAPAAVPAEGTPAEAAVTPPADAGTTVAVGVRIPAEDAPADGPAVDAPTSTARPAAPQSDPANWTADEFLAARDLRDPRLLAALERVGDSGRDPDEIALLLRRLLERDVDGPDPNAATTEDGGIAEDRLTDQQLADAIASALAAQRSEPAQQTLKDVLRGKFLGCYADLVLVRAALRGLAAHDDPEHEKVLYHVLTSPEKVRPAADGAVTADMLAREAWSVVGGLNAPRMRGLLARYAVDERTEAAHRQRLIGWLQVPRPDNLEAQAVLYGSRFITAEQRRQFEALLGEAAATTLDELLGLPPRAAAVPAATDEEGNPIVIAPPPETLSQRARLLCNGDLADAVAIRLVEVPQITDEASLLGLAANVPSAGMRGEFFERLQQQWMEYAAALNRVDAWEERVRDPGFLLALKGLPREQDPARKRRGASGTGETVAADADDDGLSARATSQARVKKEREARYLWMDRCEQFAQALAERFHAAVLERRRGSRDPDGFVSQADRPTDEDPFAADLPDAPTDDGAAADPHALPLRLHPGAEPVAEYHLSWPEDLPVAATVGPLRVHYVRLEVEDQLTRLASYYQRQLRGSDEHVLARGAWIDDLSVDRETGLARSTDVFVQRYVDEPPVRSDARERLLVEILVVEAADPSAGAQAGDVAATDEP